MSTKRMSKSVTNKLILVGSVIVVGGIVFWSINFFGMYSVVDQSCPENSDICDIEGGDAKLDQQAKNRDIAGGIVVVGFVVILGSMVIANHADKARK